MEKNGFPDLKSYGSSPVGLAKSVHVCGEVEVLLLSELVVGEKEEEVESIVVVEVVVEVELVISAN